MKLTIGLEKEMFVYSRKEKQHIPVPCHILPYDEGMMQAEFRTRKPSTSVEDAVYDLIAQQVSYENKIPNYLKLIEKPYIFLSPQQQDKVLRVCTKGPREYHNYLGYLNFEVQDDIPKGYTQHYAGIHISFTNMKTIEVPNYEYVRGKNKLAGIRQSTHNEMFDYLPLFKELDKLFEKEIKQSGRLPGFYELKRDGRIEYRSLPNNIKPKILIKKLNQALNNTGFSN